MMSDVDHTAELIVRAARRALIAGDPVDVGRIAAEVGIDRSTVFRRVGRRDRVVAEALWQTTEAIAWPLCLAAHPVGVEHRAALVLRDHVRLLIDETWFRQFLHRDPARALRILTTSESPIQGRMLALVRDLLEQEPPAPVDLDPEALAFVVVRVAESFIYADLITGATPDADAAYRVFVALLG
jgi:hypothetical protein